MYNVNQIYLKRLNLIKVTLVCTYVHKTTKVDCEQSLFCSKIRRENERDGMRDIRLASGEAANRE